MLNAKPDGWYDFAGGRRWRCLGPGYLCEVDYPGNVPSLLSSAGTRSSVTRIRSFLSGRLSLGALDWQGTGVDILVANAMTESFGTIPSPLRADDLERMLERSPGLPLDVRLDQMLREIGADRRTRWTVRREPGYVGPITTPGRVSVGAQQMLLSTAVALPSLKRSGGDQATLIRDETVKLAADALHASQLAVEYLNNAHGRHQGQLPLIAATYNAGSPRATSANPWHLVQYGNHLDRWIGFYNASRQSINSAPPVTKTEVPSPLPLVTGAAERTVTSDRGVMLSQHFSLAEMTASPTAEARHIANRPTDEVVANLKRVAALLEQVRSLLGGHPISISSGYRCPELNTAVGGSPSSAHRFGLAADFTCPAFGPPATICRFLSGRKLDFDQLILEYGRWVHLGLAQSGRSERRQVLTIDQGGTHLGLLSE